MRSTDFACILIDRSELTLRPIILLRSMICVTVHLSIMFGNCDEMEQRCFAAHFLCSDILVWTLLSLFVRSRGEVQGMR